MRGRGSNRNIFSTIYRTNHWGSTLSRSGPGSELRQTKAIRTALPKLVRRYGIRSILDIGCGDFHWMRHVRLPGLEYYIGIDVVPDVIRHNRQRYGSDQRAFLCLDAARSELPRADLVISRDCLVHLSTANAVRVLRNIAASGSKYFLSTTYPEVTTNRDSQRGKWRPLNLRRSPFNLPRPLTWIDTDFTDDGKQYPGNGLGLWKCSTW